MKKALYGVAVVGLLTAFNADAAIWNLDSPIGVLGLSHVYNDGSLTDPTITAFAEGLNALLTAKNDGPDEQGLGLTNSPIHDGEITPGSWVSFNIDNLIGRLTNADLDIAANSTAGGDIYHVYGSNSANVLGTSLFSGTGDAVVDISNVVGTWDFVNVTADAGPTGNGTVLVKELDASLMLPTVPEPSSLSLFAMAMAGFGLIWTGRRLNTRV